MLTEENTSAGSTNNDALVPEDDLENSAETSKYVRVRHSSNFAVWVGFYYFQSLTHLCSYITI